MKLTSEDIDDDAKAKIQEILNYFKDPQKSIVGYKMLSMEMGSKDHPVTSEDLK